VAIELDPRMVSSSSSSGGCSNCSPHYECLHCSVCDIEL
jgi:hypothetical protein